MQSITLPTELYPAQFQRWPTRGRHILAHFNTDSVIVYQGYRPEIGHYAADHQTFGGEFSFTRMSWIKTNFLWMMYRSGWGTKAGQEVTLAIRIQRAGFDDLLRTAVHSSFVANLYPDQATWADAVAHSSILLQWDPDHDPGGVKVERRAIQLGLRGEALERYAHEWIMGIEDISSFVAQQRSYALSPTTYNQLHIPREEVYPITDMLTACNLGIASTDA